MVASKAAVLDGRDLIGLLTTKPEVVTVVEMRRRAAAAGVLRVMMIVLCWARFYSSMYGMT